MTRVAGVTQDRVQYINAELVVTGHCHQKEYLRKRVLNTLGPSAKALVRIPACSVAGTTEITWFSETVKMTLRFARRNLSKEVHPKSMLIVRGPTFLELKRLILRPSNMHRNLKQVNAASVD